MFYSSHGWDFVGDYRNEYLSDGKVTYTNLDNVDFDNIEEDMFVVYGAGRRVFVREVV